MNRNLTTAQQNSKTALIKSKKLLNIANEILVNKNNKELIEKFDNFSFSLSLSESVEALSISADGKYIASVSLDKTIKLWDINSGKVLKTFKGYKFNAEADVEKIDLDGKIFFEGDYGADSVVITLDGKYIFSGSKDCVLKQWEIKSGKEIRTFDYDDFVYNSLETSLLTLSPNGKYVLFIFNKRCTDINSDGTSYFKLLEINSGNEVLSFECQNSIINSVSISSDGQYIITHSEWSDNIKVWDINTGQEVRTFKVNNPSAIAPDGKFILFRSKDDERCFKLLDIHSGNEIKEIRIYGNGSLKKVIITPDCKFCIFIRGSGEGRENIITYDLENDIYEKWYDFLHDNVISSLAVTPDGKYLVTASDNKDYYAEHVNIDSLKLWDIKTSDKIRTFGGINHDNYHGVSTFSITTEEIEKWDLDKRTPLEMFYIKFIDDEWLLWTQKGEYNCSDGAYKYFSFIDDSKENPEVLDKNHPVYKAKKKEKLL